MAKQQLSGIQIPTLSKLNIDGEFTLDAASGNPGQILTSAGAGSTPTWTDVAVNSPYGMVPIVPSSISSGTLSADGTITLNAASSVSLNSIFSSAYDNYYIVYDLTFSTGAALSMRMRNASSDNTSAIYDRGSVWNNAATASASHSTGQTSWNWGSRTVYRGQFIFANPYLASNTTVTSPGLEYDTTTPDIRAVIGQLGHRSATSFDGITIYPSTGTMSGTIKVYAYTKSSAINSSGGITPSNYVAQGRLTGDTSVTPNADLVIPFVDDFDPQNWWDATNKRFQPTIAGYYNVTLQTWWTIGAVTNNQNNIQIRKNGSTVAINQTQILSGNGYSQNETKLVYLNGTTDYVDFTAYTGNSSAQSLQWGGNSNGQGTFFSAYLISNLDSAPNNNYVLNGAFDFAQRGTSLSVSGTSGGAGTGYTLDQWVASSPATTAPGVTQVTISQQASTVNMIPGYEFPYYLNFVTLTAVAGTPTTPAFLSQRIEDVRTLAGKTVTLSFWAKASSNNSNFTPIIEQNFGTGGSTTVTNTGSAIALTTSWQKFKYTVTLGTMAGKTIGTGSYLNVKPLQLPAANWVTGLTVSIAGVKLELGSSATDFVRKNNSLNAEQLDCYRYYYRLSGGTALQPITTAAYYTTTQAYGYIKFPVAMRTPPAGSVSSVTAAAVYGGGASKTTSDIVLQSAVVSNESMEVRFTTAAVTSGISSFARFPANSTDYFEFTAEL